MSDKDLIELAHHEAAHAVVAFHCSVPIRYVTIVPTKDALGHLKNQKVQFARDGMFDDSVRGIDRAERHIMVYYAGALAQKKLRPKSHWRNGCGHDFEMATELFVRIAGEDEECQRLYSKLLWRRTELLIGFRWKEIQAVAMALIDRRKLDQSEVRAVIHEANGLKPLVLEGQAVA